MSNNAIVKKSTQEVQNFVDGLKNSAAKDGVLDSAKAADYIQSSSTHVPEKLQAIYDEVSAGSKFNDAEGVINRALLDGVHAYEVQHGCACPADVIEQAIQNGYSATEAARSFLDDASSAHSDPLSLQPNRAVVAILTAFYEAIPFAHYLPADIKSNEARLAILTHQAGSTLGAYAEHDLLDGVASGDTFISSSRVNTSFPGDDGSVSGKITKIQTDDDHCDADAGDLKLLAGRAIVYVDGRIAAVESPETSSPTNSPISGSINVGGTEYAITGTINNDTGVYSLGTTPALPATVPVVVEAFIDFERDPDLTPQIISRVQTFKLFAKPWRCTTHTSIDARTQLANELGLDPQSEAILAIQAQFANERHYEALRKGKRLAAMNTDTFDLDLAVYHQDANIQEAWRDLAVVLARMSQQMAEDTMNHGITHLYVGKQIAGHLIGMPSTIFEAAGRMPRPGIYRLGRLFGQYEVYYTPKVLSETSDSAQILCVGKGTDVTRNPIVLGDAVAPTVLPLGVLRDLKQGAGFYARNFTCVNPHDPSSRGFGLIDVNLKIEKPSATVSAPETDGTESGGNEDTGN